MYNNTLLLEGRACTYKQDTFWGLHIRVVDGKFVTGIYHKVVDFIFEVVSYPLLQSNVHSVLGKTTFYSQLIRFFRLSLEITSIIYCFGQNLVISSWSIVATCVASCLNVP